jgi:Protein of unknown function (DUF1045)
LLTSDASPRLAVYWIPRRSHPLWPAGCEWLGRDARSTEQGVPPSYARDPWRYGFHATLVAPMRLRGGKTIDDFRRRLLALARGVEPFAMPPLSVQVLGDFLALRPETALESAHPLRELADACVSGLDALRRPPDGDDLDARLAKLADPAERVRLRRWGYPYVFERWRFHMTLSDLGHAGDRALREQAHCHFTEALRAPLSCESLALFLEPSPGAALRVVEEIALGAQD